MNGQGKLSGSQGGNLADLAAVSTHEPVGVPAKFLLVMDTDVTFPPLATLTLAMTVPPTLN